MAAGGLRLFSVYHKPFIIPAAAYVQPIQAGSALAAHKLSFSGDDGGDNISILNPFFCELTVLYWIWKNADRTQFDYWGVVHYRRYFCLHRFPGQFTNKRIYNYPEDQTILDRVINDQLYQKMLNDLKDGCVILAKPMHGYKKRGKTKSIEQLYKENHIAAHWDTMIEVLTEKYPEYKKSLPYFKQGKMSFFNMMTASWAVWDAYLEWLFAILFEVERRIGKIDDPYQARVMGFLSERMINLFVYHQQYKTAYYPVAVFNQ
jgi:hypothetical protein